MCLKPGNSSYPTGNSQPEEKSWWNQFFTFLGITALATALIGGGRSLSNSRPKGFGEKYIANSHLAEGSNPIFFLPGTATNFEEAKAQADLIGKVTNQKIHLLHSGSPREARGGLVLSLIIFNQELACST